MTAVDWAKLLFERATQLDDYDFGGTKVTDSEKNWDMKFLKKIIDDFVYVTHLYTLCRKKKERTVVWKWTT